MEIDIGSNVHETFRRKTVFEDYEEVEYSFRKNAPQVVYKYRSWDSAIHRSLLLDKVAWFAHPFTLEDERDVRHDYEVDTRYYNSLYLFDKLLKYIAKNHPMLQGIPRIKKIHSIWKRIQENPEKYFWDNIKKLHSDRKFYSAYGIFSTCTSGLNKEVWEKYGDGYRGYCVGFDTWELFKDVKCSSGFVEYSDDVMIVNLIDGLAYGQVEREEYLKKTVWGFEKEFRFISLNMKSQSRAKPFREDAVKEILIGYMASPDTKREICTAVKERYDNRVSVFEVIQKPDGCLDTKKLEVLYWATL